MWLGSSDDAKSMFSSRGIHAYVPAMKALRLWQGVRMRQVWAQADPDRPARTVRLPVSWDDRAAEALAGLVPGEGPVNLASASAVWLGVILARARHSGQGQGHAGQGQTGTVPIGTGDTIEAALLTLLQQRQAAPNAWVWQLGAAECPPGVPGFGINVAGFHTAGGGYAAAELARAASLAAQACRLLAPGAPRYEIGLTGLDDLLASVGLAYDSRAARDVAACLAAIVRGSVDSALEGDQRDLLATGAEWPAPPADCVLPGLAEAARQARASVAGAPGAVARTGVFAAGAVDALLGVETGGVAPAFSPVRDQHLTRAAQDRLAAAAMSPEAALAAVLVGDVPLPLAGVGAHETMHRAVARYLDSMPPLPVELPSIKPEMLVDGAGQGQRGRHERLPARSGGLTQKVSVGGHRLFLRTAEYADGRLGEISLTLPREAATVRCLAECVAQAVSLGLQHGVALDAFVEAFTLTRFAPAGVVEGDPEIERATSVMDYVFRTLSATYLGRILPEPEIEAPEGPPGATPLLPLDLPSHGARRRGLRLVA
jgi:ribonucleoside-diphosphate reductase alpha chain